MGNIHLILAELTAHGHVVLFAMVAAEMLGAPLPTAPVVLAAGVLTARTGSRLSPRGLWVFWPALLATLCGTTSAEGGSQRSPRVREKNLI